MRLAGLQKLTLLDFPGEVACTVFTLGCNLRCPFCHNPELVLPQLYVGSANDAGSVDDAGSANDSGNDSAPGSGGDSDSGLLPEETFFDFLKRRRGRLSGVAVTGGEPTLHADLPDFLRRIRGMGFQVKLDTNGLNPDMLRTVLDASLADYVAMDVKNSPEKYALTCGYAEDMSSRLWERAEKSIALLKESPVRCEFRTTVALGLHTDEDIRKMAAQLAGTRPWYLQQFAEGVEGGVLTGAFTRPDLALASPSFADLERMKALAKAQVPNVSVRGV